MIEIKEKSMCCGCEACFNACPKKCITMEEDEEGFRYPVIDKEKCINCGLCNKVCPLQNKAKKEEYITKYYAAYNKNDEILSKSSSGGIFWLLAKCILEKNGVIYGVIQDSTYNVMFTRAEIEKECVSIRKSKYLQARVNDTYQKIKKDLLDNKYVLFSGTPCQVAALYKFLDKEYEKLYTVDIVCHGVPSMSVYREYIKYIEKKYKKKVINIIWRDKINGKWGPNHVTLLFDDKSSVSTTSPNNLFQRGFLYNLYLRPSCYKCKYAKIPRIGDISLADFWEYDGVLNEKNQNKGISAVIISSKNGEKIFQEIKKDIIYHSVTEEYLIARSRHVYTHPKENENRTQFYEDFSNMPYEKLCKKYKMKLSFLDKKKEQMLKGLRSLKRKISKTIKGRK